jgi:transposase
MNWLYKYSKASSYRFSRYVLSVKLMGSIATHMNKKRIKGEPALYDEFKTRATMTLTPTAIKELDKKATELGITRSELVERFARGIIELPQQEQLAKKQKRSPKLANAG